MRLRRIALAAAAGIVFTAVMPAAQAFAGVSPGSARGAAPARVLDARAVARPTAAASQVSWFSGTVGPGGVEEWIWHNTNHSLVYVPGLDPQGAATNNSCQFQVTRTWYAQQPGGATEFHFDIQNIGTLTCGTNILLSWIPSDSSFTTSTIGAGATSGGRLNNVADQTSVQVALVPTGATSSQACQIEISNTRYFAGYTGPLLLTQTHGFTFDLTNTGSIGCSATVLFAHVQSIVISTNALAVGASENWTWLNAAPGLVFIAGAHGILDPSNTLGDLCNLQITRTSYSEVIDPPAERQFHFTITNTGFEPCNAAEALLAWIS
jgi:hypothetical protein